MKSILGAAIGNCVHVYGLHHFLRLAEDQGFMTVCMGPAVPLPKLISEWKKRKPDIVALSYRLTPETAYTIFQEFQSAVNEVRTYPCRIIFGGPPPVAEIARSFKLFDKVFDGSEEPPEVLEFLTNATMTSNNSMPPDNLLGRIRHNQPIPLLRHHFGLPSFQKTMDGVRVLALSRTLDIISIGPDQNAQESFFRPAEIRSDLDGAGGVPLRNPNELKALYERSRCGNYPLLRCYAGTRDLMQWARMSVETIHNAWAAVPLCWYNEIDGRSNRPLEEAIAENQETIRWYASKNIPVEINESHQWSLRDAHDALAVAMSYVAAYNAKQLGVKTYIAQFMFNTPPGTSPLMDLAKMMAKLEMMQQLEDESFSILREVRAGIAHFSSNPSVAKGQLAASAVVSLYMTPHILHVVGFSEADHASLPEEIIESCNIIRGVIRNIQPGLPDMSRDTRFLKRKHELIQEAGIILKTLQRTGRKGFDPLTDPYNLRNAIYDGILDTPHFMGTQGLKGRIVTSIVNGACEVINTRTRTPIKEAQRLTFTRKFPKQENHLNT